MSTIFERSIGFSNRVLSRWALDENFIQGIMDALNSCETLSLDVFDTAVTRIVDSPVDVFALVEQRLMHQFGAEFAGFAAKREIAECEVREAATCRGEEEIRLNDIYTWLETLLPAMRGCTNDVKTIEIETELAVCRPVPDIVSLYERARDAGKKLIFVSDMYLPAELIARILGQCGYNDYDDLFVSSETLATKGSGRQWKVVSTAYGPAEKILHVGDDDWADVRQPAMAGFGTAVFARVRSERRSGAPLTPDIVSFSLLRRLDRLDAAAHPGVEDASRWWYRFGSTFGALVIGSFIGWIAERARANRVEHLLFCARDGWLLRKAWQVSGLEKKCGLGSSYLYVSRRPLNLAQSYLESTPCKLSPSTLDFLLGGWGIRPARDVLSRIGLDKDSDVLAEVRDAVGDIDDPLALRNAQAQERLVEIYKKYSAKIYEILRCSYESTIGYIEQNDVLKVNNCALIDLGWAGTLQFSLRQLSRKVFGDVNLVGFYFGLLPKATGNRYGAGWMEAAFASDFVPLHEQSAVHQAVDLLELLHTAPHGTVSSYKRQGERWEPVLHFNETEAEQSRFRVSPFQDGVIDALTGIFENGSLSLLSAADLSIPAAFGALEATILSPAWDEIFNLGQLQHCPNFDHSRYVPAISSERPTSEVDVSRLLDGRGWTVGNYRSWLESTNDREFILTSARKNLSHLGERRLRQFR